MMSRFPARLATALLGAVLLAAPASFTLAAFGPAAYGAEKADPVAASVAYYGQADTFMSSHLAPCGCQFIAWSMVGNHPQLQLYSVSEKGAALLHKADLPPAQFDWLNWVDESHVLVSITVIDDSSPALKFPEHIHRASGPEAGLTRHVYTFDAKGGTLREILQYPLNDLSANGSDDLLSRLPKDKENVILAYAPDGGEYPGVYKLNYLTGKTEQLEKGEKPYQTWTADLGGHIRLASGWGDDHMEVKIRPTADGPWESLSDNPLFKDGRFQIAGFSDDGLNLYLRSSLGKGRSVIYRFDLKSKAIREKVFEHPRYDAGGLITSPDGEKILAATYIDDRPELKIFDPKFQKFYDGLKKKLPGRNFYVGGASKDAGVWLVYASAPTVEPELYFYRAKDDSLTPLLKEKKGTPPVPFVPMKEVHYFSRDGIEIPAYLTLPNGYKKGTPTPMVVMPHGGPWVRDMVRHDDWAQYFASLGIGVLQPNFRGSTGYGTNFEASGYGEWGNAMQNDVADGAAWLVDQGIAMKGHLCIVGASYGGYAALMATIKNKDSFQCAVALAPVTDLREWVDTVSSSKADRKGLMFRTVGRDKNSLLKKASPARLARDVGMPLLLAHGTRDIRVAPEHSLYMEERLHKYHKNFKMLWLEGGSHFLLQAPLRTQFLTEAGRFVLAHIKP
ncbi:S9 family peptidase [Kordiimonas marina]|uniref:S9 family peptidase n=1 Tax=Kordiimonas marina TaxID=2872312 RepID=UPI001FF4A1E9|nr:prolyl oligopeptidase family serine peptidase [Kordiimonas marina]MCJ9427715.1 prolyl oligopeptidase family serine peptidase [Kordiimonas marina]